MHGYTYFEATCPDGCSLRLRCITDKIQKIVQAFSRPLLPMLNITVYLGTKCPKPGECPNGEKRTAYKPRYIIPHPNFAPCHYYANDIAVIELDKDANLDETSPICMPEEDDLLQSGTVTAIGYGYDERDRPDKLEPGLQEINLTVTHHRHMIGRIRTSGRDGAVCPGDSGGPLIPAGASSKTTLFGVASTSYAKCSVFGPIGDESLLGAYYIDVRYHLDWICNITGVCPLRTTTHPSPVLDGKVLSMQPGA
ncbi:hypothetical protein Y032_0103g3585 [Ancylostoma ceylanicum]|uniref:Peptidase S1 domain-containing protein n=1 Tax=Ancylostoma ceylanicum TaxID=53326 RepID=A0A016TGB7_9BILA|nr:hypothetical protein Y032_0103g3585 [Ancylostoma ceylanicum]